MRRLVHLLPLFLALSAAAQTRTIDGIVKTAAGAPLPGLTVAITLLPIDAAEDITALATTDAEGRFHFAELRPGRYGVASTSASACGGAMIVDVTKESAAHAAITASAKCRTFTGTVTGASGAHVIAGLFHDNDADLYAIAVANGRYAMQLPDSGRIVVQAIAPHFTSVETMVTAEGDVNLVLERRYETTPREAKRWIAARAIPLKTVEAGHGFDDMQPLRKIVGSARIVSLGEATHGTREFFQFKHRMLEFLVAQMGFNLFGIEASEPDALAVDEYVLNGKGDPAVALRNLGFWTWNTEEVLGMIKWMRKWNEDPAHTKKIRFYGFDMQNAASTARVLKPWLTEHLPDAVPLLDGSNAAELIRRIDAYAKPHDAAWELARHMAELLRQAELLSAKPVDYSARDRSMAENIQWILAHEVPGSRMAVWAHNGHISAETLPFAPGGTMGVHLRKAFGSQMVVIGFAFDHGNFQAVHPKKGLIEHHADPLNDASFDHTLATSGPPIFVLDLRPARGVTREWLDSALPMRSIGAVYDEEKPMSYVARDHPLRSYDAVFFVNETTAARPVRTPMPKPAPAAVNLSLDDGITGWNLPQASRDAGYSVTAKTDGCFSGGCALVSRSGGDKVDGFASLTQRIDATPYRGKKVRLRAKMKSAVIGESSGRIWLRVDRPFGMGFFDNMADRAPHSLPEWTDLEITGEVAPDAEAIAFGLLLIGSGDAWIDSVTLEPVE